MPSRLRGSVDESQPRPVAWVSGGPNGFMPPSSSSAWMRPMFLAIICEQSAADLVLGGSASTMAMISPSIDLSASVISDFMLTDARGVLIGARPLTSELRTEQVNSGVRVRRCAVCG